MKKQVEKRLMILDTLITADLSQTMEIRGQCDNTFNVLKEKITINLASSKIKTFPDKQKLRKFNVIRSTF